jgi:hypothetical protein
MRRTFGTDAGNSNCDSIVPRLSGKTPDSGTLIKKLSHAQNTLFGCSVFWRLHMYEALASMFIVVNSSV